jgi:hypothetical protein
MQITQKFKSQIKLPNGALKFPADKGWNYRARKYSDFGIVMHTTNGNFGSSFQNEVNFLYKETDKVCAHFIISKMGEIVQLLPIELSAYHAGYVNDDHFNNNNSIGIEQHFALGEDTNLPLMEEAAKRLIWYLMNTYTIYGIKMHREIAIFPDTGKLGRKQDPSHQTDIQFRLWRDEIYAAYIQKTIKPGALLYTAPTKNSIIATHITDSYLTQGKFNVSYQTPVKYVAHGWVWIPTGIGFVETKYLT